MKKLVFCFLLVHISINSFAQKGQQVLGLQAGAFSREGNMDGLSGSGGIFYSYNFSNHLGVEAAIIYRQENGEGFIDWSFFSPNATIQYFNYKARFLEFPLNLSVNLNKRETAAWKTNILVGGTYSYFYGQTLQDPSNGQDISIPFLENISYGYSYGNFGLEVKHNLGQKYQMALNPGLRVGLFETYSQSFIYLQLKIGRVLNKG
jgi:hypothetical protein